MKKLLLFGLVLGFLVLGGCATRTGITEYNEALDYYYSQHPDLEHAGGQGTANIAICFLGKSNNDTCYVKVSYIRKSKEVIEDTCRISTRDLITASPLPNTNNTPANVWQPISNGESIEIIGNLYPELNITKISGKPVFYMEPLDFPLTTVTLVCGDTIDEFVVSMSFNEKCKPELNYSLANYTTCEPITRRVKCN